MFYIQKEFFNFLLRSKNQHGVHSPFVYQIVTRCIYARPSEKEKSDLNCFLSNLRKNDSVIEVDDLGSGSVVLKKSMRSVSAIAKVAGTRKKYGLLLMRMINYFAVQDCLEIGTSVGIGSFCLSSNKAGYRFTTMEGCSNTLKNAKDNLSRFGVKNINFVLGNFDTHLSQVTQNKKYDLVFFDGNHTESATISYFETCLKSVHNNSVFVFDDIYWSLGMTRAWERIKKHQDITVTIDLFQFGLVFFRKEQRKEHFTIRF